MKLKDITTKIGSGATPRGGQRAYYKSGVSLIRSQNVLDFRFSKDGLAFIDEDQARELNNVEVRENDVLLNITGDSIARACLVPKFVLPARVNQHVAIIRAGAKADSHYILYYLQYLKPHLFKICGVGGTRNALTKKTIENLDFDIPEVSTQREIASVLELLDSKIENNIRINAELDKMASNVYAYWFLQFDFPNSKGNPFKRSGGKMVWSDKLKKEVPSGWKVKKIDEWINTNKSGDWGSDNKEGNFTKKVICFRGADINGLNGSDELKPPIRYIQEKNAFKTLDSHDIIIEISGGSPTQSTGRLAFITNATIKRFDLPMICSNFCKPISLKNKKLLYNFVFYWNLLYENGVFFGHEGKTSGIKNLLFDSFIKSQYIIEPEEGIVNKFYEFADKIQQRKQKALAENQKLAELRDWLLPMLMNGQVKVGAGKKKDAKKNKRTKSK